MDLTVHFFDVKELRLRVVVAHLCCGIGHFIEVAEKNMLQLVTTSLGSSKKSRLLCNHGHKKAHGVFSTSLSIRFCFLPFATKGCFQAMIHYTGPRISFIGKPFSVHRTCSETKLRRPTNSPVCQGTHGARRPPCTYFALCEHLQGVPGTPVHRLSLARCLDAACNWPHRTAPAHGTHGISTLDRSDR